MAGLADYIAASDGNGEAARAIVTTDRGIGNMDLITDSVLNWPNKFVATVGDLDTSTGLLDPDTMTVFKGHLTGSIITIEEFAPGYSDVGNTADQAVILKPSTLWADIVSQAVSAGGASVTIGTTPPASPQEGDLWGDTEGSDYINSLAKEVGNYLLPVGCIYTTIVNTNPATLLGFGTWVAWGSGRAPVGVDTGQTEFNTVEKTGGAKTHTLTNAEMPTHSIVLSLHGDEGGSAVRGFYGTGGTSGGAWHPNTYRPQSGALSGAQSIMTPSVTWGSDAPHNNLQPYITCYMWKRTA